MKANAERQRREGEARGWEGGRREEATRRRGESREGRTGGRGFELAILSKGNEPANKAPPPPVLPSLHGRWAGGGRRRRNVAVQERPALKSW